MKTLDKFTYDDGDINDIILECMSNVSMLGVIGSISFEGGADPIKNVKIERIQGLTFSMHYRPFRQRLSLS